MRLTRNTPNYSIIITYLLGCLHISGLLLYSVLKRRSMAQSEPNQAIPSKALGLSTISNTGLVRTVVVLIGVGVAISRVGPA
jgi:hypothetical protein